MSLSNSSGLVKLPIAISGLVPFPFILIYSLPSLAGSPRTVNNVILNILLFILTFMKLFFIFASYYTRSYFYHYCLTEGKWDRGKKKRCWRALKFKKGKKAGKMLWQCFLHLFQENRQNMKLGLRRVTFRWPFLH